MQDKVTDFELKSVLLYVCYAKQMYIRSVYFKDGQASIFAICFRMMVVTFLSMRTQILDRGPIMYEILSCYSVFEV